MAETDRSLGIRLFVHDIRSAGDVPLAFEDGVKERVEGDCHGIVLPPVVPTAKSILVAKHIIELAARYNNGQTITIYYLSAEGRDERYPALVAQCLPTRSRRYRRR